MSHDALLRGVVDRPDLPDPRYMLRDWLEEHGRWTWPVVRGYVLAHRASDGPRLLAADWLESPGEATRAPEGAALGARFVRVQCELDRHPAARHVRLAVAPQESMAGYPYKCDCRACDLARAELRLWAALRLWTALSATPPGGGVAPAAAGWHAVPPPLRATISGRAGRNTRHGAAAAVRRGFVAEVTCTADAWLRHADTLTAAHPVEGVRLTTLPPAHLPAFNALRPWRRPLDWGGDLRPSFAAEWPNITFAFEGFT